MTPGTRVAVTARLACAAGGVEDHHGVVVTGVERLRRAYGVCVPVPHVRVLFDGSDCPMWEPVDNLRVVRA